MKLCTRTISVIGVIATLSATALMYVAGQRVDMANQAAGQARDALLKSYRATQSLKALASGYELTMNEYYSTVLELPAYQQKAAQHKAAIERELKILAQSKETDNSTVSGLQNGIKEMDGYRTALENALSSSNKDWDGAREALYKLNVLSVRTIQQADTLARVAEERVMSIDNEWRQHQSLAQTMLNAAMALALITAALLVAGTLRGSKAKCD